jgi:hypothetical protein
MPRENIRRPQRGLNHSQRNIIKQIFSETRHKKERVHFVHGRRVTQ